MTGAVIVSRSGGVARVSVLDVGQGDAILVEGSRGGRLLIDGGPDPGRLLVVLDQRIPPWDRRIDAVILTHPARGSRRRARPAAGAVSGAAGLRARHARTRTRLRRVARAAGRRRRRRCAWASPPATGSRSTRSTSASCGRSGPGPARAARRRNRHQQRVDRPARGGRRLPIPAGGRRRGGDRPVTARRGLPRLDLLKVAHHGSRTATTQAFVDAVRPRIAVASAGAGNPYGHPARATLERLSAAGARVFRTDRDGTVAVTFGSPELTVRAEGGRAVPASSGGPPRIDGPLAFLCGIPAGGLVPDPRPPKPIAPVAVRPGDTPSVGYHPPDDDPGARGRRLPPAVPGSPGLVRAARARGRGGRRRCWRRGSRPAGSRSIGALVEAAALLHDVDKIAAARAIRPAPSPMATARPTG